MSCDYLKSPLKSLNDEEGAFVPDGFHRVIDAHVHVFPDKLFAAVWNWFDSYGWPVRYRMASPDLLEFLLSRGIDHVVAFQYAHKPGIASGLNTYMAELVTAFSGRVTGMATVFPGEDRMAYLLEEAFDAGLNGVKLHAHVQCFDMAGQMMDEIYACCSRHGKPLVIHAGREPKSPAYACDPHRLCAWEKTEAVINAYPDLKLCVPHMGMDEFDPYFRLVNTHDNLWLDTAMALTDYLPGNGTRVLPALRPDRIMYGSDFPNIPYAWDRELAWLSRAGLSQDNLDRILWKNAADFFAISMT